MLEALLFWPRFSFEFSFSNLADCPARIDAKVSFHTIVQ